MNRLELVGDEPLAQPQQPAGDRAALAGLFLALKALSARAVVALAALVDASLVASAFALWWSIIAAPSPLQITTASLYSLFILSVVFLRRRE